MTDGAGRSAAPLCSIAAVKAAGRGLHVPFRLNLRVVERLSGANAPGQRGGGDHGLTVTVTETLRLLPGRRLVARVEADGRVCLLKLFLGAGARRYLRRELDGCASLEAAGVRTPQRLAEVADPDGAAAGVLFEFLERARTVDPGDQARVLAAAAALGRLHAAGARHSDLHLENFLYQESPPRREEDQGGAANPGARGATVFMIDGDGVRAGRASIRPRRWVPGPAAGNRSPHAGTGGQPVGEPAGEPAGADGPTRSLRPAASVANLAVLCAQRPPLLDAALPDVLRGYAAARDWSVAGERFDRLLAALQRATRQERRRRVHRYLRKVQRACTEYYCERTLRRYFVCIRERFDDGLRAFRDDPEAVFQGAEMLKDGNSATVVRCRIGARSCVVKRYNVKGFWHGLRRSLKPRSRFRLAWCNGQRLHFLDIPTARPVALLERRLGPLRGVAYLVMEDRGREDLLDLAARGGIGEVHLQAVTLIFCSLAAACLAHGDTKATNFLAADEDVSLVDLDAMGERAAALRRDIGRFLANWDGDPALQRRFSERFAAAGLPLPD